MLIVPFLRLIAELVGWAVMLVLITAVLAIAISASTTSFVVVVLALAFIAHASGQAHKQRRNKRHNPEQYP